MNCIRPPSWRLRLRARKAAVSRVAAERDRIVQLARDWGAVVGGDEPARGT
jgi:hypothetical protein